jgi:tetratricopeptide (TPR) repeat protein
VTATRTHAFVLLAVLSVVVSRRPQDEERTLSVWPLAWVGALVVLVVSWAFVTNPWGAWNPAVVFLRTWFSVPPGQPSALPVPVPLALLVAAILWTLLMMRSASSRTRPLVAAPDRAELLAAAGLLGVWLVIGGATAACWRTLPEGAAAGSLLALWEARVAVFFAGLLGVMCALAVSLAAAASRPASQPNARVSVAVLAAALAAAPLAYLWAIRPAQADVAFRLAAAAAGEGNTAAALAAYTRAERLDRNEATYAMGRGVALGQVAAVTENPVAREVVLAEAEDALGRALALDPVNPYNLRLAANLYVDTAGLAGDSDARVAHIASALPLYERAVGLAPAYPDARADWARACFLVGDRDRAAELLGAALRADPRRVRSKHGSLMQSLDLER